MELKLSRGRYVISDTGAIESVSGQEEKLQRIMCRLSARRGGFYPMPEFGSRLHTLASMKPSARSAAARQFVHEALAGEDDVEIVSVDCSNTGEDSLLIRLGLNIGGNGTELTFTL